MLRLKLYVPSLRMKRPNETSEDLKYLIEDTLCVGVCRWINQKWFRSLKIRFVFEIFAKTKWFYLKSECLFKFIYFRPKWMKVNRQNHRNISFQFARFKIQLKFKDLTEILIKNCICTTKSRNNLAIEV